MRTVLAVDEMLAGTVRKRLEQAGGDVDVLGHMAMRDLGGSAKARLRELVLKKPCVLAIGAREWDALDVLKELRLPYRVPVVWLAKQVDWSRAKIAAELHVFSVVPADGTVSGLSSALAVECQLAEKWRLGHLPRPLRPVVVSLPRREVVHDRKQASVVDLVAVIAARRAS